MAPGANTHRLCAMVASYLDCGCTQSRKTGIVGGGSSGQETSSASGALRVGRWTVQGRTHSQFLTTGLRQDLV